MKKLWMYRVLEIDDEGDPLDHGIIREDDTEVLRDTLARHLGKVFGEGHKLDVRLYAIRDAESGVLKNEGPFQDVSIKTR